MEASSQLSSFFSEDYNVSSWQKLSTVDICVSCFQVCQRSHSYLVLCAMFEQVPGTCKQVKASGDFGKGFFGGGLEWVRAFIYKELPDSNSKEHHSSSAGTCLDFRVPARCALLVSCLGFWVVKASLKGKYVVSAAALLPPPYLS